MSDDRTFEAHVRALAAAVAVIALPALAQDGNEAAEADASRPAVQACLAKQAIRRTRILNDRNIVFVTRDHTIYNNELPKECPSLRRGSLVNYPVENGRLCAGGSFQLMWEAGPGNYVPAFLCQLGTFVPITEAELEDLTAMTEEDRGRRSRGRSRREAITTEQVELPSPEAPREPIPAEAEQAAPPPDGR